MATVRARWYPAAVSSNNTPDNTIVKRSHIRRFNESRAVHSEPMTNSNIDEAKGRAKEAAGALTDNDDLKREGKADQAGAKVKGAVEDAADKADDAIDAVKDKLSGN